MICMNLAQAAEKINGSVIGTDVTFKGCSTDSRSLVEGNLFIALRGEHYDGHDYITAAMENGAAAAMVENGNLKTSLPMLIAKDTVDSMGNLAGVWRKKFNIPLIAITGSNGKTTVKEMVASILGLKSKVLSTRGNLNNHIGVPLTLFEMGDEHAYAVIEMGANHPGEIEWLSRLANPTVALITLCAPAHLEGFGSEDGVARAKAEIYSGLTDNGVAIVNADDMYATFWRETAKNYRQISFGLDSPADITADSIELDTGSGGTAFVMHCPGESVHVRLRLSGRHNVQNAIAAAACCLAAGVCIADIKAGLECTGSVSGRMQLLKTASGTLVFNDTYNANPASLKAGIQVLSGYSGDRWLVLGDMGELGSDSTIWHRQSGEFAREHGIQRLYGIGELCRHAVEGFGAGGKYFADMDTLISSLKQDLSGKETLLVKGSRVMGMERVVEALMEDN